jgi:ankyrin repeat protein
VRSKELEQFLKGLKDSIPDFEDADFADISWANFEGENALHVAVIRDEIAIARELIGLGIEINARGDLGHTPLHEAASIGNIDMVKLLVDSGADLHALTEGDPPFTIARYNSNDHICDYLGEKMTEAQNEDRAVWAKAQISYLEREIQRLKGRHGL